MCELFISEQSGRANRFCRTERKAANGSNGRTAGSAPVEKKVNLGLESSINAGMAEMDLTAASATSLGYLEEHRGRPCTPRISTGT